MLNPLYLVWLGAVVNLAVGLHYTYTTVRSSTGDDAQPKPNPVSWGIWSISGWLAFFGQVTEGVRGEALLTLCVAAVPTFIFCAALVSHRRYGAYASISRLDITCGALAVVTLAAWRITASGSVAVALSIVCDALVAIPVVRQAYRDPSSDSPSIWVAGAGYAVIILTTFRSVTFIESGFALYFLGLCLLVSFLLVVRPRLLRRDPPVPTAVPTSDARYPTAPDAIRDSAAAFAGAFAADYLSWDELDPLHRAAALTSYIDGVAEPLWGWSGRGRQHADLVLIGGAELTPDGYYVVDIRVRVALIGERTAAVAPRQTVMVGRGAATVNDAAAAIEEIEIPLPGRSARSHRRPDLASPGEERWVRLQIPVVVLDGHFRIPS
jgi:hypothetical protein